MNGKNAVGKIRALLIVASLLASFFVGFASSVSADPTELFFSEYIEGSSYNKALEIFNGTGVPVDLSTYTIELYSNGASSPSQSTALSGTLADGDVFVIAHPDAALAILDVADATNGSVVNFNGDDAVVLKNGVVIVDAIGQIGFDPGSYWGSDDITTQNHTLRRKDTIEAGDADATDAFDPTAEWDGYAEDTFDGLGTHSISGASDYTPIYDIQYTTDPIGDSPFNGQTVTTQGIVTAVYYGGERVWIQDGVGAWNGLYLYSPNPVPAVGDRIEVTGPIEEYFNLTELNGGAVSILSSGNPLPAPSVVTTFDVNQEMWESVFVRVENVTVTNPDLGSGEWQVDDNSGPTVIDDMGEYTYVPVLADELDYVQGPLNYSYSAFKIEPRDDGDIGVPLPYTPIYDIQYTTDPIGDSPFNGQTVTTQGIVTAVYYGGERVWIQDGVGAWNGLYLYRPDPAPAVGDRIEVTGPIEEYFNLTELNGGAVSILSSGNPLPAPSVVTTFDVNQEMWESVFVRVENVTVTNPDLGSGEWQVDDDSGPAVIDDMGEYTYVPVLADELDYVQGPLNFSYSAFKIEPRDDGDIGVPLPYTPIYDIQYTTDPIGDSPFNGQIVTTQGIVTAVFYGGERVWIQDGVGAWNGLYLYRPDPAPAVGDRIEVTGPIEEYYNLTELKGGARYHPEQRQSFACTLCRHHL